MRRRDSPSSELRSSTTQSATYCSTPRPASALSPSWSVSTVISTVAPEPAQLGQQAAQPHPGHPEVTVEAGRSERVDDHPGRPGAVHRLPDLGQQGVEVHRQHLVEVRVVAGRPVHEAPVPGLLPLVDGEAQGGEVAAQVAAPTPPG